MIGDANAWVATLEVDLAKMKAIIATKDAEVTSLSQIKKDL